MEVELLPTFFSLSLSSFQPCSASSIMNLTSLLMSIFQMSGKEEGLNLVQQEGCGHGRPPPLPTKIDLPSWIDICAKWAECIASKKMLAPKFPIPLEDSLQSAALPPVTVQPLSVTHQHCSWWWQVVWYVPYNYQYMGWKTQDCASWSRKENSCHSAVPECLQYGVFIIQVL